MEKMKLFIGLSIFILTFYFIIKEKYPKTIVAIIGAGAMVLFKILYQEEALKTIGHNLEIISLLIGMMIIVEIMSETGIFQYVAIKIAQVSKGEPLKILILLSIATAVFSAVLDNVTTILLIVPITIFLAKRLKVNPKPFILLQIFMSNIGGTATMIGDPPNLIIASLGEIGFNEFLYNLAPVIIVNIIVLLITVAFYFKKDLVVSRELKAGIMELDLKRTIKNKKLLKQSLVIFTFVILGFLTNSITNFGLSIIAVLGATILIFLSKKKPEEIFAKLEWDTLFFFAGLFVLVEGVENLGLISMMGEYLLDITKGNLKLTSSLTLVISTILSPIIGSIPHTLSFGKIIAEIIPKFTNDATSLWWALSLGACLGGNMTIVGAAANIIGVSVSKKAGIEISFKEFFKYGIFVVAQSMIISLIYILIRY